MSVLRIAILGLAAALAGCGSRSSGPDSDSGTDPDGADTSESMDPHGDDGDEDAIEAPVDAPADDADPSAEAECTSDPDCDDGDPCTVDTCDSDYEVCTRAPLDLDGDGYPAASAGTTICGGTDCDDFDEDMHPDAAPDCSGTVDMDCDDLPDPDEDSDGHVAEACSGGDDCDDADPAVHPGALPAGCLGDADCNGFTDSDDDGDGGESAACGGNDCDDLDASVFFGATEIPCDGKDTNCDGLLDPTEDVDRDGYPSQSCAPPSVDPDCDDAVASVHPGAVEVCDEVDDDCDDTWADGGADDDSDGVLDSSCGGTDCDDLDASIFQGSAEVCRSGSDEDCDGWIDEPLVAIPDVRITTASNFSYYSVIAWSGSEFGVAWMDMRTGGNRIWFARVDGSGIEAGSDVQISDGTTGAAWLPSIAWTGSRYGLAWGDSRSGSFDVYVSVLDALGAEAGPDVRLTTDAMVQTAPSIAWNGSGFGVAWQDTRDGNVEIYFMPIAADGTAAGAEIRVTADPATSNSPFLAWSGSGYGLAFYDNRAGSNVWFARLAPDGAKVGSEVEVSTGPTTSEDPFLSWTGSEFVAVWEDGRHIDREIYLARVSADGAVVGTEIRVTDAPGDSMFPAMAWTGSRLGLAWQDERDGNDETYFAFLSPEGTRLGPDLRVTVDAAISDFPWIAWSGSSFGLVWEDLRAGNPEIYFNMVMPCD